MKTVVEKYQIKSVWHFTDESNWDSIKCYGLLSYKELSERGIMVPFTGGNQWSHDADKYKGVDQYVHLSFKCYHPMYYSLCKNGLITNPIWVEIDVSVILSPDVRFCSDVSNKSGVEILNADAAAKAIDFTVLFDCIDLRDPEAKQRSQLAHKSEILVPKIVPTQMIKGFQKGN